MRLGSCVALVVLVMALSGCGGGGDSATNFTGLRVACVGDSITEGTGTSNPRTDSYPAVLGDWLGGGYQVRNFGAGSTAVFDPSHLLYKNSGAFSQAVAFRPDIVFVTLGTNDRGLNFDDATKANFESEYESLLGAFKAANPTVRIYACLPPPSYRPQESQSTTLALQILPLVRGAAQNEGAQVVDLYAPLSDHSELFPDGIHPNTEGARLIATEVYRALTGNSPPT